MYKKLNISISSKCSKCREKRRFTLSNKPVSHKTKCNKCEKEIKVMHDLNLGKIIYCVECYQQEFN